MKNKINTFEYINFATKMIINKAKIQIINKGNNFLEIEKDI